MSTENYIDLMAYLPYFYHGVREVKELQTSLGFEAGALRHSAMEIPDQCFITTATWGLDHWERVYGLQTDRSKSLIQRREIILAKLRGSGTTTKAMIKNVATAFSGGEVEIHEYPSEFRFVVQFIGVKGIPQNMDGLITALDLIKPAHLAYSFKYTYTLWDVVKSLTWADVSHKGWADLRIYEGE